MFKICFKLCTAVSLSGSFHTYVATLVKFGFFNSLRSFYKIEKLFVDEIVTRKREITLHILLRRTLTVPWLRSSACINRSNNLQISKIIINVLQLVQTYQYLLILIIWHSIRFASLINYPNFQKKNYFDGMIWISTLSHHQEEIKGNYTVILYASTSEGWCFLV